MVTAIHDVFLLHEPDAQYFIDGPGNPVIGQWSYNTEHECTCVGLVMKSCFPDC